MFSYPNRSLIFTYKIQLKHRAIHNSFTWLNKIIWSKSFWQKFLTLTLWEISNSFYYLHRRFPLYCTLTRTYHLCKIENISVKQIQRYTNTLMPVGLSLNSNKNFIIPLFLANYVSFGIANIAEYNDFQTYNK